MSYNVTRYGEPGLQIPTTLTPSAGAQRSSGIPGLPSGGGMDPLMMAAIAGGTDFLSGMLQGPSEAEKAAKMDAELRQRAYRDSREDQRRGLGLGEENLAAQQAFKSRLMGMMSGMGQQKTDLSHLFGSRTNPFSGGMEGSGVVSNIEPMQFTPEELGTNTALPSARKAVPRFASAMNVGGPAGDAARKMEEAIRQGMAKKYGEQGIY